MVWSKFYSNSSFDEVDDTHPHRVQNLCRRLIERWYRSVTRHWYEKKKLDHFKLDEILLDDFSNTRLNSFIFWLELPVKFSSFGD